MTVLVTGGVGFIGSHLCESLVADGRQVVCVDNLSSGRRQNLAHLLGNEDLTYVECDVRDDFPTALKTVDGIDDPTDIDRIYHLASLASPDDFESDPVAVAATNGIGTYNVFSFAREIDARTLFASTSEVYGDPEVHPQPETYNGNVSIRGPRACYDAGKRYGEALTVSFHDEYGLDVRTARIFNTYGPRMRPDDGRVIPTFLTQALDDRDLTVYGNGEQTRSFLYVTDQVRALRALMDADGVADTAINVGSTDEITILTLAKKVIELTDSSATITHEPLPEDDPQRRQPDISRARTNLDWQPTVGLEEGLERTLQSYRD